MTKPGSEQSASPLTAQPAPKVGGSEGAEASGALRMSELMGLRSSGLALQDGRRVKVSSEQAVEHLRDTPSCSLPAAFRWIDQYTALPVLMVIIFLLFLFCG